MVDVVFATTNLHKARELAALLATPGIRWRSLRNYPSLPPIREHGRSYEKNAATKARLVARATGCLAIADDSGIEVEALGGKPGVRSARFAGGHGDDEANNAKLLRLLDGLPPSKRRARYRCALVLADPDRVLAVAHGVWSGRIALEPVGRQGFGYDPLFLVPAFGKTVGQLPAAVKRRLSHRARAARALRPLLKRLAQRSVRH